MEFDFSSHDHDAFVETRDGFVADLDDWYRDRSNRPLATHHVDLFLDWNFDHRRQPLRTLGRDDFEDYLLEFLPAQYLGGSEDAPEIIHSLETMVEFLALIEQLDQPFARAASIIAFMSDVEAEFTEAMADDTAGLGKSIAKAELFGADGSPLPDLEKLLDTDDLTTEQIQQLLDERMHAFNALPFEERKRITDAGPLRRDPIPLGFTFVPPTAADVDAAAQASDVLRMADGFVRIAMERGVPLTDAGNVRLSVARELVAELETGDDLEGVHSSTDLRWLTLVDDLTSFLGAVDRKKTLVRADGSWFDRSVVERAELVCDTVLASGFVSTRFAEENWLTDLRRLIDDGVPHWFGAGLAEGSSVSADDLMEVAVEVATSSPYLPSITLTDEYLEDVVVDAMAELFEGLERLGLLMWRGSSSRMRDDWEMKARAYGMTKRPSIPVGGTLELTALGRAVLPKHVEKAGYSFDTLADIADATPDQLVEHALNTGSKGTELLAQWRSGDSVAAKLAALAEHVRIGGSLDRLVIFDVFDDVDDRAVVEPVVRQLLDSASAGRAAQFLLQRGWASSDEVGGFVDLTPLVDMLFVVSDDPEGFDHIFRQAYEKIDDDLLDELWHHDQPETLVVLEAAGRFVTDKALAKRARTTAHKHRSWLGNLDR